MLFKKIKKCKKWVSCYHSFASDKYFRKYCPESKLWFWIHAEDGT